MNIAVSSYSTDLRLDIDGIIEFPAIGGGDFFPEAVPIAQELEELPSAEEAVLLAASATGRRVASAPELIAPFYREGNPFGSRWRITLDGPVRLRAASGEVIESTQIFIRRLRPINGQSAQVWSAPLAQPDGVDVVYVPQARVGENYNDYLARREAETRTIRVSRLPDMPISFVAGGITP
jgi:hypothetical protein